MPMYHPYLPIEKVIRVASYEYVGITELERKVIDTPEFQRLRYIRQCPGAYLVYPGLGHSRFEHSLGVMHLAGKAALYALFNTVCLRKTESGGKLKVLSLFNAGNIKLDEYPEEWSKYVQLARLVGLLHDVGHGPFSHVFELYCWRSGIPWTHEEQGARIIRDKFKNVLGKGLADKVARVLTGGTDKLKFDERFIAHIIRGEPFNVDRMNYLVLDSVKGGTPEYGMIDWERLLQNLIIWEDGSIKVLAKAKDAAFRFLEAYCHMYRSVYLHHKARAADIHLALILERAAACDDEIRAMLDPKDLNNFLQLDDGVFFYIKRKVFEEREKFDDLTRKLVERYLRRDILKFVGTLEVLRVEKGASIPLRLLKGFEEEIKEKAGLDEEDILVVDFVRIFPMTSSNASYRVLPELEFFDLEEGKPRPFGEVEKRYLEVLMEGICEIRVYTFREYEDRVKNALKIFEAKKSEESRKEVKS
ncbi:MAG: HD domain-containing protein [Candidatus Baldrarchaeia archaeon]